MKKLVELAKPISEMLLREYNPKTIIVIGVDSVKVLVDQKGGPIEIEPPEIG